MILIKKIPNILISLIVTIGVYFSFFAIVFQQPGDESSNELIGFATFVAMTFFINFPLFWFFTNLIVKNVRK